MKRTILLTLLLFFTSYSIFAQPVVCPPNIDFEDGNLNNWEFYIGGCCPISTPVKSGPVPGRHDLTSGTLVDKYGGFPIVSPGGGMYSLKIGNDTAGAQAERARYYVHVPASFNSAYILIYRYAVVFEDPGHLPPDQPRFEVSAVDSATGNSIPCTKYTYVASKSLPGFKVSPYSPQPVYKDWTTASIDLSKAKGKTVAVDFASGDCALGAHFGYGYVDVSCALFQTHIDACKPGDSVVMYGPPGFMSYDWYDSLFTISYGSGITKTILAAPVKRTYAVVITPYPGFGCPDTLYTQVSAEFYKAIASPDTNLCVPKGQSVSTQLNGEVISYRAPFQYQWTPSTGLSCTTCPNPVATIKSSTTYTLTVTDSTGCIRKDSARLSVFETVNADIIKPSDSVCQFSPITFRNNYPHQPNFYYFWGLDGGKAKAVDTTGGITVAWNTPGMKSVTIMADNSLICNEYDTTSIFVKETAVAAFDLPQSGCIDREQILAPKPTLPGSYHWNITEQTIGDTVYKPEYKLTWPTSGQKFVILTVRSDNGCSPPPDTQIIYINDDPPAHISLSDPSKRICFGDEVVLNTTEGRDYTYGWSPPEYFLNNNYYEVRMKAEKDTTVHLEVTNRWGCSTMDSLHVTAGLCCKVFMPSAFSPNKDGVNDLYHPVAIDNHRVHTFIITNRYGQIVYSTTSNDDGWDGKYKHTPQPPDTYFYYIKYICDDGDTYEMKGDFVLLR